MNTLYYGDNLDILRRKLRDDTVDLCYIDPPFNSKRNYFQIYNNIGKDDQAQAQAFIDTWTWNELSVAGFQEIITNYEGRYTRQTIELLKGLKAVLGDSGLLSYLVSMTQRVNEIQRVLKPTGSFYLHCDPTASHYLKLVLDGVFCGRGGDFKNEIIWQRINAKSNVQNKFGAIHDIVFYYIKKSGQETWNQIYRPLDLNYVKKSYNNIEDNTGRRYMSGDLTASMSKASKGQIYEWRGKRPPPSRCWVYAEDKMEELEKEGRIIYSGTGYPRYKRYLNENLGEKIPDIWTDINIASGNESLGYPTQKPLSLLERIIKSSSNEGDTVLDAYCGCGTTVAVAQRLWRNWIGIDITYQSIAVIIKRLEDSFGADIMNTVTLDGIPRDMESAYALANKKDDRVRKEFEKWALLTYSKNRAVINEKKGADKGIDGTAYIVTGSDTTARVIFQVKSGKVKRNDIATLNSDRLREDAVMAILITLEESTKPMRDEALAVGTYHHELLNRDYPIIQIVTIQEMIEAGKRIDLPLNIAVLKAAKAAVTDEQKGLL